MMLLLNKSQLNKLALTLSEKAVAENPSNWLFRFVRDQGGKEYLLYLTDISTTEERERFNLFNLTEGTDVTFTHDGDYHYYAYQMPDGGSEDYSLGLLVEQGIANVLKAATTKKAFEPTLTSKVHG